MSSRMSKTPPLPKKAPTDKLIKQNHIAVCARMAKVVAYWHAGCAHPYLIFKEAKLISLYHVHVAVVFLFEEMIVYVCVCVKREECHLLCTASFIISIILFFNKHLFAKYSSHNVPLDRSTMKKTTHGGVS